MGGAIAEGLLSCEDMIAGNITVCDHNQPVLDHFASLGASVTQDNKIAAQDSEIVMVVVKPWCVEQTLKGIAKTLISKRKILIVVAAGISSAQIKEWLYDVAVDVPPIFLVMPNIAIAHKASMTYIAPVYAADGEKIPTKKITDGEMMAVKEIFDDLGETLFMKEESFKGATAMSCAIGYAMRYVRANVEGAVEIGFKAKEAQKIVLQTIKGAVELLQASGEHPEAAIDKVTTPGGITIRGLNAMEHAGFSSAVIKGLKAGMPGNEE